MKLTHLLFFIFVSYNGFCQLDSALKFGGADNDIGTSLCKTDNGGLLLVGSTRSYSAGSEDIYYILLDNNMNTVWTKSYGYAHADNIRKVISVSDGYIMAGDAWDIGMSRSELYIHKISKNGDFLWRKGFGTHNNEWGFNILQSSDNYFYVLGYSRGYDHRGDVFLVKTDNSGNEIWRQTYGFDYDDYAMDLVENTDGNIEIIGSKNGFFNDVHSNYVKHDADILLLEVDTDGNEIRTTIIGGTEHDFGYGILEGTDDSYYISGSSQNNSNGKFDMFLAKTDKTGNIIYQNNFGGEGYEYCVSMCYADIDNIYLVGTSRSFSNSADIYVVKTDLETNEIWSINIGGSLIDYGNDIIPTEDGGCYIIGQSQNSTNSFDLILLKISKDGIIEDITGTDSTYAPGISLGPNPMLNSTNFILHDNKEYLVRLTDINGRIVRSFNINYGYTTLYKDDLGSGMYIYSIFDSSGKKLILSGKLIIN